MFNRDSCRYLLSCLAFLEIRLSWLSKLSYHPLMFQQQGDSFRMVLPHFWHLKSVNWEHLRGIWNWYSVIWVMQSYYLSTRMRMEQIFFLVSFLLWSYNLTSMSPLPLALHFPQLCCSWLLKCCYRLSKTLHHNGEKGKSWPEYFARINDIFLACHVKKKKKREKKSAILPTRTLLLWQNITAYTTWEFLLKNRFWESSHSA